MVNVVKCVQVSVEEMGLYEDVSGAAATVQVRAPPGGQSQESQGNRLETDIYTSQFICFITSDVLIFSWVLLWF